MKRGCQFSVDDKALFILMRRAKRGFAAGESCMKRIQACKKDNGALILEYRTIQRWAFTMAHPLSGKATHK